MTKMIFISLPITDLQASIAFYEALGFEQNPQFSDGHGACMVWSESIHVMLIPHDKWRTLTQRPFPPAGACGSMLSLSMDSRSAVDEMNIAAAARAVLVADTSVIDEATILGKPASNDEAEAMIARLAGKTHEVWTRFAIGAPEAPARSLHEETVMTRVTFRSLTSERVRAYVASGEGTDKAGGYAVQGRGAGLVARIEGSYSNVVGLPACEVMVALERLGRQARTSGRAQRRAPAG